MCSHTLGLHVAQRQEMLACALVLARVGDQEAVEKFILRTFAVQVGLCPDGLVIRWSHKELEVRYESVDDVIALLLLRLKLLR